MNFEVPSQTPLYHSIHKSRYYRQQLIKAIQSQTNRKLIVYFADITHPGAYIGPEDIAPFGDLLYNIPQGAPIDLFLQSSGGDVDKAEKIVYMCRNRTMSFRVIVAESAKSAATMIALAANEIVMGYTSELGPIDPQIVTIVDGKPIQRPARSFLDGLEEIKRETEANNGQLSPVYFPLLNHLDPALIDFCHKAIERSKKFAEKWLVKGMCEGDEEKAKRIAQELTNVEKYLSHGSVIDWEEAQKIGLKIVYLEPKDPLWELIWRLYCVYLSDLRAASRTENIIKIFESESVSITI